MTIFVSGGRAKNSSDWTRAGTPFDKIEGCDVNIEVGHDSYPKHLEATAIRSADLRYVVDSDTGDTYVVKQLGANLHLNYIHFSVREGSAADGQEVNADFGIYTIAEDGTITEVLSIASGVDLLTETNEWNIAEGEFIGDQNLISGTDGLVYYIGAKINTFPCEDADGVKSFGDVDGTGDMCCTAPCLSFDATVTTVPTSPRFYEESPCKECEVKDRVCP